MPVVINGTTGVNTDGQGNLTFSGTGQRIIGDFTGSLANRVAFQTSTTNGLTSLQVIPNGTGSQTHYSLFTDSALTNGNFGDLTLNNSEFRLRTLALGTGTPVPMTFAVNGSERMRLDTSGNLGIGTSSPSQRLQVAASTNQLSLTTGVNELIARASSTEAALYTFQAIPLNFYTNNAERMRIDASGNVGIGGSSAGNRLYVQRAAGADFRGETYLTDGSQWLIQNSNTSAGSYSNVVQANDASIIYSSGTTNNGAFTIAQWSSSQRGIRIDATGNFQFNSGYGSVATAFGCRAWVNFNGTGTVAIRASGNVSSITDNNVGDYTVNFTTALPDANYGVSFATGPGNGRTPYISTASFNDTTNTAATLMSTTQLRVIMSNTAANLNDTSFFCVSIFR